MTELVNSPRARQAANAVAGLCLFVFAIRWLWPAPFGVMIQGVVIGGLTSLIAFGLALTYRSNRIINFAQGDLGGVPASLAVLLILESGVSYFLAFPIAIVTGLALGAVVEFLFIRRFRKAPRLILTVVTIGVSQILAGVAFALPRAFGLTTPPQDFPSPFTFEFSIGQTVFHANEVVAMLVVPIVIVALGAFFRYTRIGIAVRASAENADRAALLGVPVMRIQTVVWMIATVLATIAIFLRAGIVGLPLGSVLGPTILIRALAAAVIGRMEKLPTIFVASLALGVVEACIVFSTKAVLVDPVLFLVVLGALLLQRRGATGRVSEDEQSTWQASRQVRPIPKELASLPEVVWGRRVAKTVGVIALFALPLILNEGQINLAAVVLIFAMVGISLVVLTGWAGQVSLGQVAFVGVGAAVGGYLTASRGWDIAWALPGAGLAGAAAAMIIGLPALRVRGLYLAVVTLAFALATSSYFLDPDFVHWIPTTADRIDRPDLFGEVSLASETRMYVFVVVIFLLSIWMTNGLRHSRAGRVLDRCAREPARRAVLRRERDGREVDGLRVRRLPRRGGRGRVRAPPDLPRQLGLHRGPEPTRVHHGRDRRARLDSRCNSRRDVHSGCRLLPVVVSPGDPALPVVPDQWDRADLRVAASAGRVQSGVLRPARPYPASYSRRRRGIHVPSLVADNARRPPPEEPVVLDLTEESFSGVA